MRRKPQKIEPKIQVKKDNDPFVRQELTRKQINRIYEETTGRNKEELDAQIGINLNLKDFTDKGTPPKSRL